MATGLASGFVIYQDLIKTRIAELLAQNGNAFGAVSNNAIRIATQSRPGDYSQSSFFKNVAGLITRRNNTSTAGVTDLSMTMDEFISVKLSRKIGPIGQTRDSFKKLTGGAFSPALFTGVLAEEVANAMQLEMLNTALRGTAAALKQVSGSYYTAPSLGSMTTDTLVAALAKMGDRADRIVCWVMHSSVYYTLVRAQIASNITGISNFNVANAQAVTLGRPVIVTDSSALQWGASPDVTQYLTLGLVDGAVLCENTEEQEIVVQDITGLDTLVIRYQGEYAYNLGIKGFKWDTLNGGANPVDSALNDGSNWDTAYTDLKDRAGVAISTL